MRVERHEDANSFLARAGGFLSAREAEHNLILGLSGRLSVLEGGEVTLNERHYQVERGDIAFLGEREILPSFDLQMTTEAGNYDVTLGVTGVPGETETTPHQPPSSKIRSSPSGSRRATMSKSRPLRRFVE